MEYKIEKVTKITLELTKDEYLFIDFLHEYFLAVRPVDKDDVTISEELKNLTPYVKGA